MATPQTPSEKLFMVVTILAMTGIIGLVSHLLGAPARISEVMMVLMLVLGSAVFATRETL